jgi:hypothetical protein
MCLPCGHSGSKLLELLELARLLDDELAKLLEVELTLLDETLLSSSPPLLPPQAVIARITQERSIFFIADLCFCEFYQHSLRHPPSLARPMMTM